MQITDLSELVGKTISRVIGFSELKDDRTIGVLFTDGSFVKIELDLGHEYGDERLRLDRAPYGWGEKIAFGLATEEDLRAEKARERQAIEEAKTRQERETYERLKEKFGD